MSDSEVEVGNNSDVEFTNGDLIIPSEVSYNGKTYTVTHITHLAFIENLTIKSLTLPKTIKYIGAGAFRDCDSLKYAYLGNSDLDTYVFSYCDNLESIVFERQTHIGEVAFFPCDKLNSIEILNDFSNDIGKSNDISAIDFIADNTGLEDTPWYNKQEGDFIYFGHTLIGYRGSKDITSIDIPEKTIAISSEVFEDCNNLETINFPSNFQIADYSAFTDTKWYANKPDGLITINSCCIKYKGQADGEVIIPDGIKAIAWGAFLGSDIKSISIPNGVYYIGTCAFGWRLESISLPSSLIYIDASAFSGTGIKNLILPEGLKTTSHHSFSECDNLQSIVIPSTLETIGFIALDSNYKLENINVSKSNPYFMAENGVLYNKLKTKICHFAEGGDKEYKYFKVPDGITTIETDNFPYDTISVPTSVTTWAWSRAFFPTIQYEGDLSQWININRAKNKWYSIAAFYIATDFTLTITSLPTSPSPTTQQTLVQTVFRTSSV